MGFFYVRAFRWTTTSVSPDCPPFQRGLGIAGFPQWLGKYSIKQELVYKYIVHTHSSYITVLLHKCFYGRAGAQPYRLLNIHIDEHKGEEMGHKIGWGPYPLTLGGSAGAPTGLAPVPNKTTRTMASRYHWTITASARRECAPALYNKYRNKHLSTINTLYYSRCGTIQNTLFCLATYTIHTISLNASV